MANYLGIKVEKPFNRYVGKDWLRRLIRQTLITAGINTAAEVSLVITDDQTVRQLNKQYRGIDRTTDVLSFSLLEGSETIPFALPADGILHLGEVILSYPQAERQAQEYQHPVQQEVALLVVHGVLHLAGYDHQEPGAEKKMKAMEEQVLGAITPLQAGTSPSPKPSSVKGEG